MDLYSSFYGDSRLLSTILVSFMALSAVQAQNDLSGFSVLPSNITAGVSSPARFDCQARPGAGFIRWTIGSNLEFVSETNCDGCHLQANGSLYIASVTQAHGGLYTCLIVGGNSQTAMFGVYLTIVTAVTLDVSTMITVITTTTTMASDTSTVTVVSTTATPNDVPISNDSGSSSGSGPIIGGVVGGIILLLMNTVVLCIVILCIRRHHIREPSQEYDQVLYNRRAKLSSTGGEDGAMGTDSDANTHRSSHDDDMHDDSVQLCHNMVTDTKGNVEDDVPIHTSLDHTKTTLDHAKLTGEHKYGAINQSQCDDPTCDTTIDHSPTTNSCSPLTVNTMLTDEDKYGDINQPTSDDLSFDTTADQSTTAAKSSPLIAHDARSNDEGKYGVIYQPQCDNHM